MQPYLVSALSHYCNITVSRCQPIEPAIIPFYDLTFVLEGTLVYRANHQTLCLNKYDAILLPPGTFRERDAGQKQVSYVSFNFQIFENSGLDLPHYLPDCITPSIRRLVSVYPTSHLSSLYYSREKCMMLLNYILLELLDNTAFRSSNEHILGILRYIEEHLPEKLTLKSISEQANLSREYTSFLFRREMNKTLTDYVNERKLLLAKELISSGEMSLGDISRHIGFENYNYFCRLYTRQFGISPGKMRKKTCSSQ